MPNQSKLALARKGARAEPGHFQHAVIAIAA